MLIRKRGKGGGGRKGLGGGGGVRKTELEFLKSQWGLGTEEEEVYRTGPPGNIGWRNSFLESIPGPLRARIFKL